MKKLSRKLSLNRETLIPLTPDALDGINGGLTPGTISTTGPTRQLGMCVPPQTSTLTTLTQSRFGCPPVSLNNK